MGSRVPFCMNFGKFGTKLADISLLADYAGRWPASAARRYECRILGGTPSRQSFSCAAPASQTPGRISGNVQAAPVCKGQRVCVLIRLLEDAKLSKSRASSKTAETSKEKSRSERSIRADHGERGRRRRGDVQPADAGDLRNRASAWRRGDGPTGHLVMVVGGRRRAFDQFFAARPGRPAGASSGGALEGSGGQPRLFRWISDGRAFTPAAVHGKHRHRSAARHGRLHADQPLAARPALERGAACEPGWYPGRGTALHLHAGADTGAQNGNARDRGPDHRIIPGWKCCFGRLRRAF